MTERQQKAVELLEELHGAESRENIFDSIEKIKKEYEANIGKKLTFRKLLELIYDLIVLKRQLHHDGVSEQVLNFETKYLSIEARVKVSKKKVEEVNEEEEAPEGNNEGKSDEEEEAPEGNNEGKSDEEGK